MRGNEEILVEGVLCREAEPSGFEVWIESFLAIPVIALEGMEGIVLDLERRQVTQRHHDSTSLGLPDICRLVQQTVAHEVDKPVLVHARRVVREQIRVLLDKTDDVIVLLDGRLETAKAVSSHDELVTTDATTSVVQTDIRRIAQAITPIERVTCVYQHILNVQASFEIVVCECAHNLLC